MKTCRQIIRKLPSQFLLCLLKTLPDIIGIEDTLTFIKNLESIIELQQFLYAGYKSFRFLSHQLFDRGVYPVKLCDILHIQLANAHHSTAQELDKKLRELARIIRYTEQYQTNLPYKHRYSKSKDPDGYLRRHETEISLCEGAEYMLKKEGIDPDKIDLDAMRADYEEMKKQKDASMKTYAELNADARKLEKLTETLEHYLERENRNRTRTDGNDTLSSLDLRFLKYILFLKTMLTRLYMPCISFSRIPGSSRIKIARHRFNLSCLT